LLVYTSEEDLPSVSILMAAHNEEAVLKEKIESIELIAGNGIKKGI
jgi:hypothetical protein